MLNIFSLRFFLGIFFFVFLESSETYADQSLNETDKIKFFVEKSLSPRNFKNLKISLIEAMKKKGKLFLPSKPDVRSCRSMFASLSITKLVLIQHQGPPSQQCNYQYKFYHKNEAQNPLHSVAGANIHMCLARLGCQYSQTGC